MEPEIGSPQDNLHEWRPSRWLQIIYGVWIDQSWYWQNVLPSLPELGMQIFIQGALGAILIALSASVLFLGVLGIMGIPIDWIRGIWDITTMTSFGYLGMGILRALIAPPFNSSQRAWSQGPPGIVWAIPWGAACGMTAGISATILFSPAFHFDLVPTGIRPSLSVLAVGIVAASAGLAEGVATARRVDRVRMMRLLGSVTLIVMLIQFADSKNVIRLLYGGVTLVVLVLSAAIGNWWALRLGSHTREA